MNSRVVALLAAFAAVIGSVAVVVSVDDNGHPHATITVLTRNGKVVEAPASGVQQVQQSADPHANLGAENGATPGVLRQDDRAASPLAPRINGAPPLAAPHQDGCLTRTIPTNWSYRSGVRPSLIVLHYTVSPNVAGWSDENSIDVFFSRSATQASSNYVIDNEGHCILMVPESEKAWAQAGFNSATACSIEVINTGSEATYVGPDGGPGQAKLAQVVHDCAARWHIPLRRGAVSGCGVTRSGVVDHTTLGACGGGHADIGKFRAIDIDKTIRNASHGTVKPVSARQRKRCYTLNHLRRRSGRYHRRHHLRPAKHPLTAKEKRLAKRILAGEKRYHLRCRLTHKPHLVRTA